MVLVKGVENLWVSLGSATIMVHLGFGLIKWSSKEMAVNCGSLS